MGIREIAFNPFLMAAYAGYYLSMLRWRAVPHEIWKPGARLLPQQES
jgi:hypothetical protein